MFSEAEMHQLPGATAYDAAGTKIGSVGDVYLDDATGVPAWVTVTTGLMGLRSHVVPLAGAVVEGRKLTLAFGRDVIAAAPRVAQAEHLSGEEESVMYAHFGITRPAPERPPQAGEGSPAAAPAPAGPGESDAPLLEAERATQEAISAAEKADPLGDGSYAGDASKGTLIDTPDLEAHDHGLVPEAKDERGR